MVNQTTNNNDKKKDRRKKKEQRHGESEIITDECGQSNLRYQNFLRVQQCII